MIRKIQQYPLFSFGLLAAIFFLPFLGGVHLFDWDEVNFAEIAREMVLMDNYLQIHVNYIPFTEKPPGFFWLQALSMNLFGIGEYGARFPNAVFGIITLPSIYYVGNKINGRTFGILWALAYFGTILPNLYFKSGIIDPVFNYFIFMGLVYLIFYIWKTKNYMNIHLPKNALFYLLMAGVFTGFAILAKGPVAYLITALVLFVYWVSVQFKFFLKPLPFLLYSISTLVVTLIWYGVEYYYNGPTFILEFIERQWTIFSTEDAGHGGFPGYHLIVLFFGCFPATAFAIHAMINKDKEEKTSADPIAIGFKKWMTILFWVILILFSIVQSKIVHYSSMAYFPITYLAALSLFKIYKGEWKFEKLHKVILGITLSPLVIAPILINFIGFNPEIGKKIFAKDPFAVANLDADINWTGLEIIPTILLVIVFVLGIRAFKKRKTVKGAFVLFGGTAVWVFLILVFFVTKIEGYSQNENVEFWKSKKLEDCYLFSYKYKTYTKLFYGVNGPNKTVANDKGWHYLTGPIKKPVYFSFKINREEDFLKEAVNAKLLYRKNGFCFYVRDAVVK